ncbi:SPOR domain-containing protein [Dysgonomonas sp. 25]|uniref:SPOR domain-containing protein n=1 Tax=Dysgonomonas sp. 25 TaxID=2302933 RepID=UPI0013D1F019|nr:SPOR domain-containing protein [Dysgonomonas sp. 25]NDV68091.1 SPOR domain-containing protein [Dysgonomonas sp. 25]
MNKKYVGLGLVVASLLLFGSCKPKQSAYKQVYEAAKEREMDENKQSSVTVEDSDTPVAPAYAYDNTSSSESVRKEKITPVYDSDASGLKAYNVVIAAMGMKPNAESLKKRIEAEGYKVILAKNESGMFRVIIASADTKDEAVAKKNQILSDFYAKGDTETLRAKYGIPFNDWWILQRTY